MFVRSITLFHIPIFMLIDFSKLVMEIQEILSDIDEDFFFFILSFFFFTDEKKKIPDGKLFSRI